MPKVTDRRIDKSKELLKRLENGPAYFLDTLTTRDNDKAEKEALQAYKRWSQSWIIPLVKELVPELREKK